MNPIINFILLFSMMAGTILAMTSHHWVYAWLGLELNTLAIIPIISKTHHPRATEASTKYFLIQAISSALFLLSGITNAYLYGTWDINHLSNNFSKILLTIALATKLGLAPVHFWLPEVLQGVPILTALIIATWQKVAPMALLIMTWNLIPTPITLTMGLLSTIIGGLGGLNQTPLRKMMAYSSIAHLGWMVIIITIAPNLTLLNLTLYMIFTSSAMLTMHLTISKTLQNAMHISHHSPIITSLFLLSLLSLGGLPPMSGFSPKWLILQELTLHHLTPLALSMALMALLSLMFYLRATYISTMTLSPSIITLKTTWRLKSVSTTSSLSMLTPPSLLILPIMPLLIQ
uniref:NADH-ubiquinone oxidoreductase chain 2 n=1 Tax=Varanus baritji TaxID=169834 RepID=NU2M_VARBA|nr:RecName: Full=NADH-ubiquinone oxidoreductase chain 2; AltName: Full=NADH dehydrogenase subunit 2 [Varanus baritji]AAL10023.1 NADH dehydrogenase subunit 2 [Varanus baritji]